MENRVNRLIFISLLLVFTISIFSNSAYAKTWCNVKEGKFDVEISGEVLKPIEVSWETNNLGDSGYMYIIGYNRNNGTPSWFSDYTKITERIRCEDGSINITVDEPGNWSFAMEVATGTSTSTGTFMWVKNGRDMRATTEVIEPITWNNLFRRFYKQSQVDEKIENIPIPVLQNQPQQCTCDLSNYYTKAEVDKIVQDAVNEAVSKISLENGMSMADADERYLFKNYGDYNKLNKRYSSKYKVERKIDAWEKKVDHPKQQNKLNSFNNWLTNILLNIEVLKNGL